MKLSKIHKAESLRLKGKVQQFWDKLLFTFMLKVALHHVDYTLYFLICGTMHTN